MCSQLARFLRLRAPILNFSLQYTQNLSLRATYLATWSGMSYFVAFLRTREEIPYLFLRISIDASQLAKSMISSRLQMWSASPAAIADVIRKRISRF